MKAALPLAKSIATASCRSSNTAPWRHYTFQELDTDLCRLPLTYSIELVVECWVVVFNGVHTPILRPGAPTSWAPGAAHRHARGRAHFARAHSLHRKYSSPLLGQLGTRLGVRIEESKVTHDDGHWQGDRQHPRESTQAAHEHAHVSLRGHITVTHSSHGHYGPPESDRDAGEIIGRVILDALGVVYQGCEDDDAKDEEEDEEAEFMCGCFERVDEDLEPRRVAGQLEEAHDTNDGKELEYIIFLFQPR